MTRPIEQHMRVTVCRWCGARAEECGGTCVSATELVTLSRPLTDAACLKEVVIGSNKAEVIELPCQQHQSGTAHSESGTREQGETTHTPAASGDTDASGTDAQMHG